MEKNVESIKIEGIVEIRQGDRVVRGKNHFTDAFMKTIISFLGAKKASENDLPAGNYAIYIGTDISTPSSHDMTQLVSPIGETPGTPPDTKAGWLENPGAGIYQVRFQATWNPGKVSGTIGEVALYLYTTTRYTFGDSAWWCDTSLRMVSRLAVADGAFDAFTIDESLPLTIQWIIRMSGT